MQTARRRGRGLCTVTNANAFSFRGICVRNLRRVSGWLLAGALLVPAGVSANTNAALPFADIQKHWAKEAILQSVEDGLMRGTGNGMFQPERAMTRAEFFVLLDRLLQRSEQQLATLTLLNEHDENGWGEGFSEPYLPYTDVDRLDWMYPSVLRVSLVYDRLYGPRALEQLYPGKLFRPDQPITHGEALRLLQLFWISDGVTAAAGQDAPGQAANDRGQQWLPGEATDVLVRGEAAWLAERLNDYLQESPILPLLDADGSKFPLVPQIFDLFPLFAAYTDHPSADEQAYLEAVRAIADHEDDQSTYQRLQRLADSGFPNQVGVHYYLSWNPDTLPAQNMDEAFRAIDAYFDDKVILPDRLRLLSANVYDIALFIGEDDDDIYAKTLKRLAAYESKLKQGTPEWQVFSLYVAALQVKAGQTAEAIRRYQSITAVKEGLLNALYYLIADGHLDEAKNLLQQAKTARPKTEDGVSAELRNALFDELTRIERQETYADRLQQAFARMDALRGYRADGEAMLNGYLFKYTQQIDQIRRISHTTGYFQSPDKLVLEKLEMYNDDKTGIDYSRDFESDKWTKSRDESLDYIHEWVDKTKVYDRLHTLHARYVLQTIGPFDVITEWIPGEALRQKTESLSLAGGRVKQVPACVTKYYIDRESGLIVRRVWRYEEVYESRQYVVYEGSETYSEHDRVSLTYPFDIVERAVESR